MSSTPTGATRDSFEQVSKASRDSDTFSKANRIPSRCFGKPRRKCTPITYPQGQVRDWHFVLCNSVVSSPIRTLDSSKDSSSCPVAFRNTLNKSPPDTRLNQSRKRQREFANREPCSLDVANHVGALTPTCPQPQYLLVTTVYVSRNRFGLWTVPTHSSTCLCRLSRTLAIVSTQTPVSPTLKRLT